MSALILKLPSLIFHLSVALRMTHCAAGRRAQAACALRPSLRPGPRRPRQVSLLPAHTQGPSGLHQTCGLVSGSSSARVHFSDCAFHCLGKDPYKCAKESRSAS